MQGLLRNDACSYAGSCRRVPSIGLALSSTSGLLKGLHRDVGMPVHDRSLAGQALHEGFEVPMQNLKSPDRILVQIPIAALFLMLLPRPLHEAHGWKPPALSTWLFLQFFFGGGRPFCGCPYSKSSAI